MKDEETGKDRGQSLMRDPRRTRKPSRLVHDSERSSFIRPPSSLLSRWRNAILGTLLVVAGLATAMFTLLARRLGDPSLAGVGAVASLVFVLLISILVVPPLTRSAFVEISRGFPIEVTTGGVI